MVPMSKPTLLFSFLLWLVASPLQADESAECVAGEPLPLIENSQQVSRYQSYLQDQILVESFVLNEQMIEIRSGGCYHFRVKYRFALEHTPELPPAQLAVDLLTPLAALTPRFTQSIIAALQQADKHATEIEITLDYDSLFLETITTDSGWVFEVSYDIAL